LHAKQRPFRLREDAALEHLHWASTRNRTHTRDYPELNVLAMDHRSQFERLCADVGGDPARIPAFKALALKAVDRVANGDPAFGVLLDGRYGMRALEAAAHTPYWIGRPIELPGSCPLEFESSPDVATEIATWPYNHVIKCLAFYHPDDAPELRERQERQLLRLADTARKTRHELLVEIIPSQNGEVVDDTTARVIERLYQLDIRPDWWKLEPDSRPGAWRNIEATITRHDPHCRGVLLLGLNAPEEQLIASFAASGRSPIVKGFAVGRTIWSHAASQWLANKIDDETAIDDLARRFSVLVNAWREVKHAELIEEAA